MTNDQLGALYGVSRFKIVEWRKETNATRKDTSFKKLPIPARFVELAPQMNRHEAELFFGLGHTALHRMCLETGVRFRPPVVIRYKSTHGPLHREVGRDMSRAGMAADYLRRFGPIWRCDSRGTQLSDGAFWRRNMAVLTDDEVIERAQHLGWRPDSLKVLAA
jgi:hypothetical protein